MESAGDRLTAVTNPRIAELGRRGQAAAALREPPPSEPLSIDGDDQDQDVDQLAPSLRLVDPERACVETNLTRRGFWLAVAGGPRQLALPLEDQDRFGSFAIEPGPRGALTVTELEVLTWLCSRWRELSEPRLRRVPLSLSQLASDFGWAGSGNHLRRLADALDRLTDAAITSEVWAPREHEARMRERFHLIDRWRAGDPNRSGQLRRYGWVELGSWLLEQLRGEHLTFVDWPTLRSFERPLAKRLYLLLEAERFALGPEKRWPVDRALFVTLGMATGKPRDARARLAEAARDVEATVPRYPLVVVRPREAGRGHFLVVRRRPR